MSKLFQDIRERLKLATPGPWKYVPADEHDDWMIYNSEFTFVKQDDSGVPVSKEDGTFIAHSPTDIARLLKAVDLALAIIDSITDEYGLNQKEQEMYAQLAALSSEETGK